MVNFHEYEENYDTTHNENWSHLLAYYIVSRDDKKVYI